MNEDEKREHEQLIQDVARLTEQMGILGYQVGELIAVVQNLTNLVDPMVRAQVSSPGMDQPPNR